MFLSLFQVLSLIIYTASCKAGLYPTRPVANTVFHGGQWNDVVWKDTASSPRLHELRMVNMDLWLGDTIHLASLAKNVDPMKMKQSVFIPPDVWTNATNCVIQFKSETFTIYTAYFSIDSMTGKRTPHVDHNLAQALASSSTAGSSSSSTESASTDATNVLPGGGKNDLVTVTMTSSDAIDAPLSEPTNAGPVGAMVNDASSGGRHVRRPSMHFNFVFVLFPALFGLALAL